MKLSTVILDMDGTITRFNLDFLGVRRAILAELEEMNLRTANMTERLSIYVLLKQLKQRLDAETYEKLRKRFYGLLEEMEAKAAQEVVLQPGVLDTLHILRNRDLKIGLVTSNSRKGTGLTLKRLELSNFFDAVVTRDDCEEMKPDPGPLKKVLKELDARADEAVFVGDWVNDIMAAKEAGMSSAAVFTGPFDMEHLLLSGPDNLLGSLSDLPSLIRLFESSPEIK